MTLLERLLDAGYPKDQIFHHCSDLYVFVTPLTKSIIDKWCKENGFRKELHVSTFSDQITGRSMYDVAFQWHKID